jgi:hypothetical protein
MGVKKSRGSVFPQGRLRKTSSFKPAIWEGMDKSTLVHTQIQIIIIHFLPYPISHGHTYPIDN